MKTAPLHQNEKLRLASLEALNILDSLPEKDFDEITQLASQICAMPIALISLVDQNRQWFKAKVGLSASETPRDMAFCAHAILQNDIFIVEDAAHDERFFDNPLVTGGPSVQFYAGAPLLSPDGQPIGTVCVIDTKSNILSEAQKSSLMMLSNQVTRLLELRMQIKKHNATEAELIFKSTAFLNMTEGIVLQDSMGAIIEFNPAALLALDLSADQLQGKTSFDPQWQAIHEDMSDFSGETHPAILSLKTGEKQKDVVMGIKTKSGNIHWLRINSVPLYLNGAKKPSHAVTSFANITSVKSLELKQQHLQLQLVESARLSSLGEMASGVAHEINNPLAIIGGKTSLLKRRFFSGKLDAEYAAKEFQTIENTVDRIAKIITGLRNYSRDAQGDAFLMTPLASIIEETAELCREKLRSKKIILKINCDPNIQIECRGAQISQVLMNMLINSQDAICELEDRWIDINVTERSEDVELQFTDSGQGISEKLAQKIMQPFFTTKDLGKGTGLGLSISSAIAEKHNGQLQYDPTSPNTRFKLTLPIVQPEIKKIAV